MNVCSEFYDRFTRILTPFKGKPTNFGRILRKLKHKVYREVCVIVFRCRKSENNKEGAIHFSAASNIMVFRGIFKYLVTQNCNKNL